MKRSTFFVLPLAATAAAMAIIKPHQPGNHPIANVTSRDQAVADGLPALMGAHKTVKQAIEETPAEEDDKVLTTLIHDYPKIQPSTSATIASKAFHHPSRTVHPSPSNTLSVNGPYHSLCFGPVGSWSDSLLLFMRHLFSPGCKPRPGWRHPKRPHPRPHHYHNQTTAYEHATSKSKTGTYGHAPSKSKTTPHGQTTLTHKTAPYADATSTSKALAYDSTTSSLQTNSPSITGPPSIAARTAIPTHSNHDNATVTTHTRRLHYASPPRIPPNHTYRPGSPAVKPVPKFHPRNWVTVAHHLEAIIDAILRSTKDAKEHKRLRVFEQRMATLIEGELDSITRGLRCPKHLTPEEMQDCLITAISSRTANTAAEESYEHMHERGVPSQAAEPMLTAEGQRQRELAVRAPIGNFTHAFHGRNSSNLGANDEPLPALPDSTGPVIKRAFGMLPESVPAFVAQLEEAQNKPVENVGDDASVMRMHDRDVYGAADVSPVVSPTETAESNFRTVRNNMEAKPLHKSDPESEEVKSQDGSVDEEEEAMGLRGTPVRAARHTVTVTVSPS